MFGLRMGAFFNNDGFERFHQFIDYHTIVAYNWEAFINIDRHDFSVGLIYPLMIEAEKGEAYGSEHTIGALLGYRYYLFNPRHKTNLFLLYEFQYIYFSGNILKTYRTESYHVDALIESIRNVFGIGFSLFFDKNKYAGISMGCGYIIPYWYEKYDKIEEPTHTSIYTDKWLDEGMNSSFSFFYKISFRLPPFYKKKK